MNLDFGDILIFLFIGILIAFIIFCVVNLVKALNTTNLKGSGTNLKINQVIGYSMITIGVFIFYSGHLGIGILLLIFGFVALIWDIKPTEAESRQMMNNRTIKAEGGIMCPKCGIASHMSPISERKGGFSKGKAAAGAIVAGPMGLVAGTAGKSIKLYKCPNCGYTFEK